MKTIFVQAKKFQQAFNRALNAGCSFMYHDEESSERVKTASEFIELSKGVELCALAIKFPCGKVSKICFTSDYDYQRHASCVEFYDYSDSEALYQYFGEYLGEALDLAA